MPSDAQHASLVERYADLLEAHLDEPALLDVVADLDALCAAIQTPPHPPLAALLENEETTFTLEDPALSAGVAEAEGGALLMLAVPRGPDAPSGPRHISSDQAARWRRIARQGRRLVAAGLVAALVLAFAAVLVQRTRDLRPGTEETPTVVSATPSPGLVTPTAEPTVIRQARAPTVVTPTPFAPKTVAIEPLGSSDIMVAQDQACTSGMAQFVFIVIVDLPAQTTSITFAWQHYDGSTALSDRNMPYDGQFSQAPDQSAPLTPGPTSTAPYRYQMTDTWTLPPNDFSGSQARWGDEFMVTAVDGKALATPIASSVLYYATGC